MALSFFLVPLVGVSRVLIPARGASTGGTSNPDSWSRSASVQDCSEWDKKLPAASEYAGVSFFWGHSDAQYKVVRSTLRGHSIFRR